MRFKARGRTHFAKGLSAPERSFGLRPQEDSGDEKVAILSAEKKAVILSTAKDLPRESPPALLVAERSEGSGLQDPAACGLSEGGMRFKARGRTEAPCKGIVRGPKDPSLRSG